MNQINEVTAIYPQTNITVYLHICFDKSVHTIAIISVHAYVLQIDRHYFTHSKYFIFLKNQSPHSQDFRRQSPEARVSVDHSLESWKFAKATRA